MFSKGLLLKVVKSQGCVERDKTLGKIAFENIVEKGNIF